ncbi:hypothetical protein V6N13_048535 [Hibiscus sabdariffa]
MSGNNLNAIPQRNQNNFYAQEQSRDFVTLRSGRQCEAESSAKQVLQSRGKEPVDETPVEPEKDEDESHSTVKKDSANEQVDAKQ